MKLKYYLRGLGLGIIVASLIMGLHYGRSSSMTDAQIKERAAELGMVESTTLAEASADDETKTAQELLDEMNEEKEDTDSDTSGQSLLPETDTGSEDAADDSVKTDSDADTASDDDGTSQTVSDGGETSQTGSDDSESAAAETEDTTAETGKTTDSSAISDTKTETVTDAADDPDRTDKTADTAASSSASKTTKITIVSGDSSYSVAKKLAEAGLVPDAAEYDAYLCNNGYDRYIRTGTYEISSDDSNADIARAITGK